MFENYKDILTPSEVSEALGIGRNSIYKFLKDGAISSIRVGRRIIIPKIYLFDFIEINRVKGGTIYSNDDIIHTGRASTIKGG